MKYRPPKHGAFVLILILGLLVILIGLALGFLQRTATERSASSAAYSQLSAAQLADTVSALVQGQIALATSRGIGTSWASQPGMVRAYDSEGSLLAAYKLYSAPGMVATEVVPEEDLPPADWATRPAIWTDLNAPAEDASGRLNYPILQPDADAEGFTLHPAPGATVDRPAPMPVRWLYLLRDGTLVPAGYDEAAGAIEIPGERYSAGHPNAPDANPVIGRIAFWTDDETSRVNVNTAAGGVYWDTPRARTSQEEAFGNFQPARNEFQRYPGHPATVDLAAVFPGLSGADLYRIAPRIVGGGSEGGTAVAPGSLAPDTDRLYASVDELILAPDRSANPALGRESLERARFFLSAHSRAPELNLFNLPRVSIWPVFHQAPPARTTVFDRLIAHCAAIQAAPYYFQREDALSPVHDLALERNGQLYAYLQALTSRGIPGFGNDFLTKYGSDRNQILTEIFDYIRSTNLYDDLLPANAAYTAPRSSGGGAGPGHGWVTPARHPVNGTQGFGRAFTISELGLGLICNATADDPSTPEDESYGSNQITGPEANAVLGGTPLDPGEKYIQAIFLMEFFSSMHGFTLMAPDMRVVIKGLDTFRITRDGVTQELFPGLAEESVSYTLDPGTIAAGRSAGGFCDWRYCVLGKGSPARGFIPADPDAATYPHYPFIGVPVKIKAPPAGETLAFSGGTLTIEIHSPSTVPPDETTRIQQITATFPPGDFPIPTVAAYGLGAPAERERFAWTSRKLWWGFRRAGVTGGPFESGNPVGRLSIANWGPGSYTNPAQGVFLRGDCDVVRTLLPKHGDYRLLAASPTIAADVFQPHRHYHESLRMSASNFSGDQSNLFPIFDRGGRYFADLSIHNNYLPDIAADATATPEATGDFDTGVSLFPDGPFINKPDEGNIYRGGDGTGIPYFYRTEYQTPPGVTFFSPNRQVPSPGMFGSLPSGVRAGVPWRTLLFRPQPGHFGQATPPGDHLLLDLFWMPVVEPYAISDPFSTAGKINLNFQILPFTYLERATGIHALLRNEKLAAIPDTAAASYKATLTNATFRLPIDAEATLAAFRERFAAGDLFRSESEIATLPIHPVSATKISSMADFWKKHRLTGDNLRERIYTTLYPRLTTRSNTFTIYYRIEALQKVSSTPAGYWREGSDVVLAETRGSTTMERYIDTSRADIPDYAARAGELDDLPDLSRFYRWRILSRRLFAP